MFLTLKTTSQKKLVLLTRVGMRLTLKTQVQKNLDL